MVIITVYSDIYIRKNQSVMNKVHKKNAAITFTFNIFVVRPLEKSTPVVNKSF